MGTSGRSTKRRTTLATRTSSWTPALDLGRKVLLPAGVIQEIDLDTERVLVRLTKEQIKNAPELDETMDHTSDVYREKVGSYYSSV